MEDASQGPPGRKLARDQMKSQQDWDPEASCLGVETDDCTKSWQNWGQAMPEKTPQRCACRTYVPRCLLLLAAVLFQLHPSWGGNFLPVLKSRHSWTGIVSSSQGRQHLPEHSFCYFPTYFNSPSHFPSSDWTSLLIQVPLNIVIVLEDSS